MVPIFSELEIPPAKSLKAFTREVPMGPFHWHYHAGYELNLVIAGSGQRFVGDDVGDYGKGDLVLLGPYLPHCWQASSGDFSSQRKSKRGSSKKDRTLVIQFQEAFLGTAIQVCPELKAIETLLRETRCGMQILGNYRTDVARRMEKLVAMTDKAQLYELLKILDLVSQCPEHQILASEEYSIAKDILEPQRLRDILNEIRDNFRKPLQQRVLARNAGLTPAAYSRFFHSATGVKFIEYVNDLRVGHACRMLIETDMPVTDVCFDSGFTSLSNFNRAFRKRRQMSPSEFRERFLKA